MFKFITLVVYAALAFSPLVDGLTVNIQEGSVEGIQQDTYSGGSYYAFYSIPYAQPPTGALRFQAPVPVESWTGVKDATTEGNICHQVSVDSPDENEDCLSLNVYTPKDPSTISQKLPVLFFIHGGSFVWGSGQTKSSTGSIGPAYFMDSTQVVVVTVNYRLGPFGFFSTGDSVIPGNAGLKDQLLALKWVQNNIAVFGGDPSKVTIFGESAGGASVGYLIVSPAAKGLFSAAILSSGTSICPWAYQRNQTEITFKTASFVDPQFETNRDSNALLTAMQSASAQSIDDASNRYTNWAQSFSETGLNGVINAQLQQGLFYAPVVEAANSDAFLTEKPYEVLSGGSFNQVPILIGTCADEGLMNLNQDLQWTLSVLDSDHSYLVPQGMHIADYATRKAAGDAIKNEYSPSGDMQNDLVTEIRYYTDQDFKKSIIRHAELHSKYSDVYFYQFSYSGQMGGNSQVYPGTSNVSHSEEGNYIWQRSNPTNFPQTDQTVHQRLMKIWLNFITQQNPTPTSEPDLQSITWPKLTEGNLQYVDITSDLSVKTDPEATYSFWKQLFQQYGVPPYETY